LPGILEGGFIELDGHGSVSHSGGATGHQPADDDDDDGAKDGDQ
jgi:hypothetical protein